MKKCSQCKKRLGAASEFECRRCGDAFCAAHRLPEDHTCKNPENSPVLLPPPVVPPKIQKI